MRDMEVKYSKYMNLQSWVMCWNGFFVLCHGVMLLSKKGDFVREIEKEMQMCLWAEK